MLKPQKNKFNLDNQKKFEKLKNKKRNLDNKKNKYIVFSQLIFKSPNVITII